MRTVKAICEKVENGYEIKSPLVGIYSHFPENGAMINHKSACGFISVLFGKHILEIPEKIKGVVKHNSQENHRKVEYKQLLFTVENIADISEQSTEETNELSSSEQTNVVRASTDGMFYRRPTPDEPAYVNVGDTVRKGQVLGLVEVMKTFNQVLYSGDGLPETGVIKEVCVDDGGEVKNQQVLFVIE